jgi:hypothetical protein
MGCASRLFASLCVLGLATGLGASVAFARPPLRLDVRRTVLKQDFTGYGIDARLAEQHALEQACAWLAEKGPFEWTPPVDYLRQKGLVRFSEPTEKELQLAGPMKVVKLDLEITEGQAEEIRRVARQQRMTQRHLVAARVLVGLVTLLLVAGGYLHLEERTRGYFTTLLRAAAVTVLALVGAGLWLLA